MRLEIGKRYKIVIKLDTILTYSATVVSIEEGFVTFLDRYNDKYTYSKSVIVSYTELGVEDGV